MNEAIRMQLSAFVDGELPENEAELLLRRLSQDMELRQQAAEYMAIGRAMRGEQSVSGIERLRDRIAGGLDDKSYDEISDDVVVQQSGYLKPLAGFAVAATVAVVAIFGLQRTGIDEGAVGTEQPVADIAEDSTYTVPTPDDELQQLYILHGQSSPNSIKARRASFDAREGEITEDEAEDDTESSEENSEQEAP